MIVFLQVSNALGNKILKMQKEVLNTEIKNILFGFADCLMYKPAMVRFKMQLLTGLSIIGNQMHHIED